MSVDDMDLGLPPITPTPPDDGDDDDDDAGDDGDGGGDPVRPELRARLVEARARRAQRARGAPPPPPARDGHVIKRDRARGEAEASSSELDTYLTTLSWTPDRHSLTLFREEPAEDKITKVRLRGLVRVYRDRAPELDDIQEEFGGGIYRAVIKGPDEVTGRIVKKKEIRIEIQGEPIVPVSETDKRRNESKVDNIVNNVIDVMKEDQVRQREELKEERRGMAEIVTAVLSRKDSGGDTSMAMINAMREETKTMITLMREESRLREERAREDAKREDERRRQEREDAKREHERLLADIEAKARAEETRRREDREAEDSRRREEREIAQKREDERRRAEDKRDEERRRDEDRRRDAEQRKFELELSRMQQEGKRDEDGRQSMFKLMFDQSQRHSEREWAMVQQISEKKTSADPLDQVTKLVAVVGGIRKAFDGSGAEEDTRAPWERALDKLADVAPDVVRAAGTFNQQRQAQAQTQQPQPQPQQGGFPARRRSIVVAVDPNTEPVDPSPIDPGTPWVPPKPKPAQTVTVTAAVIPDAPVAAEPVLDAEIVGDSAGTQITEFVAIPDAPMNDTYGALIANLDLGIRRGMTAEQLFNVVVKGLAPSAVRDQLKMWTADQIVEFIEANVPPSWVIASPDGDRLIRDMHALLVAGGAT